MGLAMAGAVLVAGLLLLAWLRKVARWLYVQMVLRKIPHVEINSFLWGTTDAMTNPEKLHRINLARSKKHGGIMYVRMLHYHVVIVSGPALVHYLMSREVAATKDVSYTLITQAPLPWGLLSQAPR